MNYIVIVSRNEFSDLFRFGHIFVHNCIPIDGDIWVNANNRELFNAVTKYMNTYEYSTEYLILNLSLKPFAGTTKEIFIKDVTDVYALDADARNSLAVSFDRRINLQVSPWSSFFNDLSRAQAIRQAKAGMFNCFEIFEISQEDRQRTKAILRDDIVVDLFTDLFEQKRPRGIKSIWTYLIRYERHWPYYNDYRGFFSDAVHAFENYIKKEEIDYEIGDEVPISDVIFRCSGNFNKICETIVNSEESKKYFIDGCSYLTVAAIFLCLRAYFRDGGITQQKMNALTSLSDGSLYRRYSFDLSLAIGMLGLFLSQENTYGCYYEKKNIGIFQRHNVTEVPNVKTTIPILDPATGRNLTPEETQALIAERRRKEASRGNEVNLGQPMEQNTGHTEFSDETQSQSHSQVAKHEQLIDLQLPSESDAANDCASETVQNIHKTIHYIEDVPSDGITMVKESDPELTDTYRNGTDVVAQETINHQEENQDIHFPVSMIKQGKNRELRKVAHDMDDYKKNLRNGYKIDNSEKLL